MEIIIDNFDFWHLLPQKYYSFSATYKGDRKQKAKSMCLSEHYLGARKVDGAWNMIIRDSNGNFHMRSRKAGVNGNYVDKAGWVPQICENLSELPNESVLVGEIYLPKNEGSRKVTSVLNCLKDKSLQRQAQDEKLHFYIFDVLAWNGKSIMTLPFKERVDDNSKSNSYLNQVKKLLLKDELGNSYIEIADYKIGEELWNLYGEMIEEGKEGIVITHEDYPYTPDKRTAWQTLKMKKDLQDSIDAFLDGKYKPSTRLYGGKEIENWNFWENVKTGEKTNTNMFSAYCSGDKTWEPITKAYYYGWAAAVSFSVIDNGQTRHLCWISGITDELKNGIVNEPKKWINKVAAINAMEIECIDGRYSLRHGRINCWRDDKQPEDCSFEQIKRTRKN